LQARSGEALDGFDGSQSAYLLAMETMQPTRSGWLPGAGTNVQGKGPLAVNVLLVSGDTPTVDSLCHSMEEMAMRVNICSDIDAAVGKLCHAKFDAIVVDLRYGPKALEFLKKPRQMTSHKGAVVMALLNNNTEMPSAFRTGASFTIVRPLNPAIVNRTLRASYPLMVREMRRYYRCPMEVKVDIACSARPDFSATSVNISEGGMALVSSIRPAIGEELVLKLTLPGAEGALELNAEVCWSNDAGRIGLELVGIPVATLTQLQSWLSDRLEDRLSC
jgi:ActR/RegA family two-component response regulator